VDEILGYLLGDLSAFKACSLTCKPLFGATRPLIHRRVCLASRLTWVEGPNPKESLPGLRRGGPEAFERLVDADRSDLLRYIQHLTFKLGDGSFNPENMQKYHPHLRSIPNLHTLTPISFLLYQFIPVFDECFGVFAGTLRHLDIRNAYGTDRQLFYIISQFPLLEDLTIVCSTTTITLPWCPVPAITQSPPLRGTLVLVRANSGELFDGLATLPGGLNCHSLEFLLCKDSQAILDACSHCVTSVSYLWEGACDGVSNSCIRAHTAM